jgi:CRISPR-associated protein Csm2
MMPYQKRNNKDQTNKNGYNIIDVLEELENLSPGNGRKKSLSDFLKPEDYAKKNGIAYKYAKKLRNKIKINQIRTIFDSIRDLERSSKYGVNDSKKYLLLTQVAYAVGRDVVPKSFYEFINFCIERIDTKEDVKTFVRLFEAIIAYFKFLS